MFVDRLQELRTILNNQEIKINLDKFPSTFAWNIDHTQFTFLSACNKQIEKLCNSRMDATIAKEPAASSSSKP